MGKNKKKTVNKTVKKNKNERVCERCGNGGFSRNEVFKCKYCGYLNGVEGRVEVTKGPYDKI